MAWLWIGGLIGLALAFGLSYAVRRYSRGMEGADLTVVLRSPAASVEAGPLGPFELTFSDEIAPSSLAARIRLDGGSPFKMDLAGGVLSIVPAQPLLPGPHRLIVLSGVQSTSGATVAADLTFELTVREPQILFTRQQGGRMELFVLTAGGPKQLSGEEQVVDYSAEPHGQGVLYSAANAAGGTDLWWVDRGGASRQRWLDCGQDICSQPAWSPAGDRFAFSRRPPAAAGGTGRDRVWTAARGGAEAAPLYQDPMRHGNSPSWSPDGRWLSFYDLEAQAVILLDLDTVSEQVLPSGAGVGAVWSPAGDRLLFLVLDLSQGSPRHLLYRVTPASETSELALHPEDGWQDVGLPAWSPSGEWLAFSAQRLGGGRARSLWRTAADGSGAVEIAADPEISYGGPTWSPAGDRLLFQRFPLTGSDARPDLMVWPSGADSAQLEIAGAGSGGWLP